MGGQKRWKHLEKTVDQPLNFGNSHLINFLELQFWKQMALLVDRLKRTHSAKKRVLAIVERSLNLRTKDSYIFLDVIVLLTHYLSLYPQSLQFFFWSLIKHGLDDL